MLSLDGGLGHAGHGGVLCQLISLDTRSKNISRKGPRNRRSLPSLRRKTFPRRGIHTEVSPLRCAPVEMTRGREALPGREVADGSHFHPHQVGRWPGRWPMITREDKGKGCGSLGSGGQTQGEQPLSIKVHPSPLSSRPKRSAAERFSVLMPLLGNVFRMGSGSLPIHFAVIKSLLRLSNIGHVY
jgi:hypothetical protein